METSVQKLEVMLSKTESELDTLSSKVDQEIDSLVVSKSVPSQASPSNLIENVQQLRSELSKVSADVTEYQKQHQQVMTVIRKEISSLSDQFDVLNKEVPLANEEQDSN